jgi:hypothetical protein
MTLVILIGAAILLSAGFILQVQRLDMLRAGRIRLAGSSAHAGKARSNRMTKH